MLNSSNSRSSKQDSSPEVLVKDLEKLTEFINHPAWVELVQLVKTERERAMNSFIDLPVRDLGTFLEREQLIGEARAYSTVLNPVIERFEELKEATKELNQQ